MDEIRVPIFAHGEITGTETNVKQTSMLVIVKMDTTAPVGKVFADRFTQRMGKCVKWALKARGGWVLEEKSNIATLPEEPIEEFFEAFIASFLKLVSEYVPSKPLPDNQSDQIILEVTASHASTVTTRKFGLKFPIPKINN